MAYVEREGQLQLKPVACYEWKDKSGVTIGVKFDFVDATGAKIDGAFGWTKKDGSASDNIEIITAAMEAGKSLLCEVQKGRPKQDGGFFYSVKWPVGESKKSGKPLTPAQIRELGKAAEIEPAASDAAPSSEIPF